MKTRELGTGRETLASGLYASLRTDLIDGAFAPGERLRIKNICHKYQVGLSPVREALNRLSVEGFVVQSDHRGFAAAAVSKADLLDLTRLRCALNELALRESVEQGEEAWADSVALAFHRLDREPRFESDGTAKGNPEWNRRHRAFHAALLAGSSSLRLRRYCDLLFDQNDRYRSFSAAVDRDATIRRTAFEHREIMEAALARNADLAAKLLSKHFARTSEWLLAHWQAIEPSEPRGGSGTA